MCVQCPVYVMCNEFCHNLGILKISWARRTISLERKINHQGNNHHKMPDDFRAQSLRAKGN